MVLDRRIQIVHPERNPKVECSSSFHFAAGKLEAQTDVPTLSTALCSSPVQRW